MTKEEARSAVMGAISMALTDPTLQQGFEIICKENAELKEQNKKLLESCEGATMMYEHLTKAKELLKQLLVHSKRYLWIADNSNKTIMQKDIAEAEQFLSEM